MRSSVRKWGNSASVRIPASVMEAAKLTLDQAVDVREKGGLIIIEPIAPAVCDVAVLVAGITDENLHEAIDTGPPAGREAW